MKSKLREPFVNISIKRPSCSIYCNSHNAYAAAGVDNNNLMTAFLSTYSFKLPSAVRSLASYNVLKVDTARSGITAFRLHGYPT